MTALILSVPANLFPFMTMELYGNRNTSTIWGGVKALAEGGSWFIALVVFLASIVVPFLKLAALLYLSLSAGKGSFETKYRIYLAVEALGRWSMLDIFLLAILVAVLKFRPWTNAKPEVGSLLFLLVVIFTMLASAAFDPRSLRRTHGT